MAGKGENAGYQHFLLVPQFFKSRFFPRNVKSWDQKLNHHSFFDYLPCLDNNVCKSSPVNLF